MAIVDGWWIWVRNFLPRWGFPKKNMFPLASFLQFLPIVTVRFWCEIFQERNLEWRRRRPSHSQGPERHQTWWWGALEKAARKQCWSHQNTNVGHSCVQYMDGQVYITIYTIHNPRIQHFECIKPSHYMILFDIRRSVSLIFQKMSCFTLQRKGKSVLLASQGVIVKPATSHNLLYSLVHLASVDAERMLFGQKTPCCCVWQHAGTKGSMQGWRVQHMTQTGLHFC